MDELRHQHEQMNATHTQLRLRTMRKFSVCKKQSNQSKRISQNDGHSYIKEVALIKLQDENKTLSTRLEAVAKTCLEKLFRIYHVPFGEKDIESDALSRKSSDLVAAVLLRYPALVMRLGPLTVITLRSSYRSVTS
ncbi:hypothetical protein AAY473_020637 [Plecturocebus cupreus]